MVLVCLPVVCPTAGVNSFCGQPLFSFPLSKPAGLMLAGRLWGFLLEWKCRTGAFSQEFHRKFEASLISCWIVPRPGWMQKNLPRGCGVCLCESVWLGVTVLSSGKHVLVAEVFSLPSAGHPAKENRL